MTRDNAIKMGFDHYQFETFVSNQAVSEGRNCIAEVSAEYVVIRNSNKINYFCIPVKDIVLSIQTIAKFCSELQSDESFWTTKYQEKEFRLTGNFLRTKLPNLEDCPVILTIWGVQSKSVFLLLKAVCSWINGETLGNDRVLSLESIKEASKHFRELSL
jgi:hypothetical protein